MTTSPEPRLAARMARVEESATLRLSRLVAERRQGGADLVDLAAGEPDFDSPAVAVAAAQRALAEGYTRYTSVGGDPALLQALASRFRARGAPWTAAQGLVTVGAKAALLELALALLDQGDEVVIPSPCWVSLPDQARLAGARVTLVPMQPADGFALRSGPLLEAVGPSTRVMLVNSPCNPTGAVIEAAELERLVEGCAARGVVVISDETYDRFVYGDRRHASIAPLAARFPHSAVLVGSFSKTYAMTGWRVGYLFGPSAVVAAARTVQSHATSNVTSFAMKGALAALDSEAEVRERLREYEARRDVLVAGLQRIPGISILPPAGTFYVFPDCAGLLRPGLEESGALAEYLLDRAGVVVVPGSAFGAPTCLRISYAASRAALAEGLERMRAALSAEAIEAHLEGGR